LKYYHFTQKNNILNILKNKKLLNNGTGIYVCDNVEDSLKFINLYIDVGSIQKENTIIIEFESDNNFTESFDHNSELLNGAKAFVCWEDVNIKNVKINSLY